MTEPWWRPIADALAKRVAKEIMEFTPSDEDKKRIIDAAFEDVPAKPPRTRRKVLPAPPDPNVTGKAPTDEK